MKKSIITTALVLLAVGAQAQIKMHNNGRITLQTIANTNAQGVSIGPAPDWNVDFNGNVFFNKEVYFNNPTIGYAWMNCAHTTNPFASTWVVAHPNWNTLTFYVLAYGDAYANNHYTITSSVSDERLKGREAESIDGVEALDVISKLNGFYYAPVEMEIPNLENDENVDPEAVEAMYADFEKRSVGLSGIDFVEAFPEGVRTDLQNRLCINYSSVVTMLVEAVKEQQREIEELHKILEDNGLIGKNH